MRSLTISAYKARRFAPRAASNNLTKREGMKWIERSMVLGANWRLATDKSYGPRKKPGRRMHGQNRKDGEDSSAQATNITPAKLLDEWLYFCRPGRCRFLRSF